MDFLDTIITLTTKYLLPQGQGGYLLVSAALALSLLLVASLTRKRVRRRWRVKASYAVLDRLESIPTFPRKLGFLRSIDPFLLEETILSALDLLGWRIKRNIRYTGDGGIDGQAWHNGQHYLIQTKRYSSHISKQHIADFDSLCRRHGALGLFVHTGKTGRGIAASETQHVSIISGKALLDLLEGRGVAGFDYHPSKGA